MGRKKAVKSGSFVGNTGNEAKFVSDDSELEFDENGAHDGKMDRLQEGLVAHTTSGCFTRMRPPGYGPDFERGDAFFD